MLLKLLLLCLIGLAVVANYAYWILLAKGPAIIEEISPEEEQAYTP